MALLIDCLKAFCLEQGFNKTYWIGYSGGLDSHVLLHLCAELRKQYPLRFKAVHVHHGLSINANDWSTHCEKICNDLQIEFIQKWVNAKASHGESPEEVARNLRYAVFAELLVPQDILLTAHQQDDQAETLLVQLFRGAGPKGLSAMPLLKTFAAGFHARPFLSISRADLKHYAQVQQLTWINDESNDDKSFTRNFLRHSVLPILKQRWPTVTTTLARVAENCAETEALISHIALEDLALCRGESGLTLSLKKLKLLNSARQRQVLRTWFVERGCTMPSSVKLHQIQHDFFESQSDKSPLISWGKIELRRYRDELYILRTLTPHDVTQVFTWDLIQPLNIPSIGELRTTITESGGLRADIQQVTVRFRQGGERCYFPGRGCHHLLKHLMQEWGIPPWERDRIPLLFVRDTLIAIIGFFLHEDYQSMPGRHFQLLVSPDG